MPKDYRQRIYDKYASRFQDTHGQFDCAAAEHWGIAYKTYLKGWLPENKDVAILEVACGRGRLLHFLKTKGYTNFLGIDISPEQILLAKQVTNKVAQANAIEFLKAKECEYDLIIGLDIVEHFTKEEVICFLDVCFNALKPNGRLVLQTCNADSPFGLMHLYGDFTHEVCFNTNSLGRMFKLVGFEHVESREAGPVVHGFASAIRFVIWHSIRMFLRAWNLAETGSSGSGVFTRIFLISTRKKR